MSIANELSSDVAAAMLMRNNDGSPRSTRDLAEVVKEVHSTLRLLTAQSRRKKARPHNSGEVSLSMDATSASSTD